MRRLELHARDELAISLIRRGMRTSIVRQITGIHPLILRELHHEIHGRKPVPGQLRSSSRLLGTPSMRAGASLFASLYGLYGGASVRTAVDIAALVKAHDLHLELVGGLEPTAGQGARIDLNQAWILARDLMTGVVRSQFCRCCRVHYLVADDATIPPSCPLCALKEGHGVAGARRRGGGGSDPNGRAVAGAACPLSQEGQRP